MTDDEMDDYATRLAEAAKQTVGSPIEGACVLMQAGLALLISSLPISVAVEAVERISEEMIGELKDALGGAGQTRQ